MLHSLMQSDNRPRERLTRKTKRLMSIYFFSKMLALRHVPRRDDAGKKKGDLDTLMLITGETGSGKSTLAIRIAKKYCKILGLKFDYNKHLVYTGDDFLEKTHPDDKRSLPRFSPVVVDEAHKILFSRNFQDIKQKMIIDRLEEVRKGKNFLMILCMPDFLSLDVQVRRSKLKYWFYLPKRGVSYVFQKDTSPASRDRWHLKELSEIKNWEKSGKYKVKSISTWMGVILFKEINDKEWDKYEETAIRMRRESWKERKIVNEDIILNNKFWWLRALKESKLLKQEAIASLSEIEGKSKSFYYGRMMKAYNPYDDL